MHFVAELLSFDFVKHGKNLIDYHHVKVGLPHTRSLHGITCELTNIIDRKGASKFVSIDDCFTFVYVSVRITSEFESFDDASRIVQCITMMLIVKNDKHQTKRFEVNNSESI